MFDRRGRSATLVLRQTPFGLNSPPLAPLRSGKSPCSFPEGWASGTIPGEAGQLTLWFLRYCGHPGPDFSDPGLTFCFSRRLFVDLTGLIVGTPFFDAIGQRLFFYFAHSFARPWY